MRLAVLPMFVLATAALAQSTSFAPTVRLRAGDQFLGENRLFPSPVYHDLDGDGRADIVVGDLAGHLTVAAAVAGAATPTFGPEQKVHGADGDVLDFENW